MHDSMGTTQSSELANQPMGNLQEACLSLCRTLLHLWVLHFGSFIKYLIHQDEVQFHTYGIQLCPQTGLELVVFLLVQTPSTAIRGACHHTRHRPLPSCFSVILSGQGVSYVFVSMISILDRNDLRERGLSHSLFLRIQLIMTLKIHLTHQLTAGQPENRERRILRLHIILFPAAREFPLEIPTETYLEI